MARRLPYGEGDWFAVPLRSDGFGVGIVACHDGHGGVVGYLMGRRFDHVPAIEAVERFTRTDSLRVVRFGDLGLIRAMWPVIGRSRSWNSADWPLPAFARRDASGVCYRVEYERHDLAGPCREVEVGEDECNRLPRDALSGSGAVEKMLTALLDTND